MYSLDLILGMESFPNPTISFGNSIFEKDISANADSIFAEMSKSESLKNFLEFIGERANTGTLPGFSV